MGLGEDGYGCTDASGTLYVGTDTAVQLRRSTDLGQISSITHFNTTAFTEPRWVITDASSTYMVVSDIDLDSVFIYKKESGSFEPHQSLGSGTATADEDGFNNPQGMVMDADRNLYVADTNNNRIVVYSYNADSDLWELNAHSPISGTPALNGPVGLGLFEMNDTKFLAVSNQNDHRVQLFIVE